MFKKISIFFIVILLALHVKSQIYFNKTYDHSVDINFSSSVLQQSDSGYLAVGEFLGTQFGGLFFVRTDKYGDTIWTKDYPKFNSVFYTGASGCLITTLDNNFALAGVFIDSFTNADALLVKFDSNGDTLWTKTYGGAAFDNANVVIEDPADSGFVLIGVTQSFGNGGSDFYMIKTDKNGNQLWYQTYGTAGAEDAVSGIRTLDGGYILAGRKGTSHWIQKTDALGNQQWNRQYTGTGNVAFVNQMADSNLIIVGAKFIGGLDWQAWIAKADKYGFITWENTYGGTEAEILYTIPIIQNDGSIVCAGIKNFSGIPYGYLLKVDGQGNQQWARTYYKNTVIDNYFYDVKQTSDNGFIMVGSANNPNQDHWLVKVDSVGCEIPNCNVGINEINSEIFSFDIYPNPTNSTFTISGLDFSEYKLEIYNAIGENVFQTNFYSNQYSDTPILPKGVYFVRLISSSGITYTQKLIIQ